MHFEIYVIFKGTHAYEKRIVQKIYCCNRSILQILNQFKFTHNNVSLYLVYMFIPNTINHITRAGMLIDSRKIALIFSIISDMMDWPSRIKIAKQTRASFEILSSNKRIYYKNCKHAIIDIT